MYFPPCVIESSGPFSLIAMKVMDHVYIPNKVPNGYGITVILLWICQLAWNGVKIIV